MAAGGRFILLEDAEQSVLSEFSVALGFLSALHGFVQDCHELGAVAEDVHGAGFDERFDHAFVKQPQVNFFAELKNRSEASHFLARRQNRFDGVASHVLHRGQTEANGFVVRGEVGVADVDVRRFYRNLYLAAFIDVFDHVVNVSGLRGEQRGHELHRIVALEIGDQGVRSRVRLIEAVACELLHQIKEMTDFLFRESSLD